MNWIESRERFLPLVGKICKENGTAMRIGTNHGSLSDPDYESLWRTGRWNGKQSCLSFLRFARMKVLIRL